MSYCMMSSQNVFCHPPVCGVVCRSKGFAPELVERKHSRLRRVHRAQSRGAWQNGEKRVQQLHPENIVVIHQSSGISAIVMKGPREVRQ
eukprot:scaffold29033_cov22-Prasinocladus_malaysianus.AAC.1